MDDAREFRYKYKDDQVEAAQSLRRDRRRREMEKKQAGKKSSAELKAMARNRRIFWLLVAALVVFLLVLAQTAVSIIELTNKQREAEEKLAELTRKRDQLIEELKEVESSEYVEQEARSELRMIFPDEYLYIVDSDKAPSTETGPAEEKKNEPSAN